MLAFTAARQLRLSQATALACKRVRMLRMGAQREFAVQNTAGTQVSKNASPAFPTFLAPPHLPVKTKPEWENCALLVDKPQGWTSHDVCAKLKGALGVKKIGHAGTLDPRATGLLIVCVGKGTKSSNRLMSDDKVYTGVLRLGEATPTYDAEMDVDERQPWEHVTDAQLQDAVQRHFTGDIEQMPPIYSAVKVKGVKLCDAARRNEAVERTPRSITIHSFEVWRSDAAKQDVQYRVRCSKGTYVRALAHDLGRAVGTCAHVLSIRREASGPYDVESAWNLAALIAEGEARGLPNAPAQGDARHGKRKRRRADEAHSPGSHAGAEHGAHAEMTMTA